MAQTFVFSDNILTTKNIEKKNGTWNGIKKKKNMIDEKGYLYDAQDYKQILIDNKNIGIVPTAPKKKVTMATIKEYISCPCLWRGMGLMFFYQFAG